MVVYDGDASILVAKYRLVYLWFFLWSRYAVKDVCPWPRMIQIIGSLFYNLVDCLYMYVLANVKGYQSDCLLKSLDLRFLALKPDISPTNVLI